ncbi:ADP-ribosylglycohydrolase family protein [Desulfogranum mediterraneum]|uniref:ADP-ribosylglycohydrolase family protein n=1 Tax=Desulfogranum mediterraneum TaxID=160661 RepID=UPI000418847F|nr:ADP-ribosylglycohydrolase family protein [Desulfogranum mediterraneum]
MTDNAIAMVLASFTADALALAPHWIYDTQAIKEQFGRVDQLLQPRPGSYHAGKKRGDFTHYGDQALVLLQSLARHQGFQLDAFCRDWQQLFRADYTGYLDGATNTTLAKLEEGTEAESCGSSSADLGGAARIAPLIFWYHQEEEALLRAVSAQTEMTHNHPATVAGALFLARSVAAILRGDEPRTAITRTLEAGLADLDLDIRLRSALDSEDQDSGEVIRGFGQACSISSALPGAVHLVLAHPDDLQAALIANVMAGGDSAARGLAAGMLLGAHLGVEQIPQPWLREMSAYQQIMTLLARKSSS